jgi:beta-lactamase regulating signal transducer with metallopeptidase domain
MNTFQEFLSSSLVSKLGWTLIHSLWQGALIMLLLGIGLRLLRSSPARYLASCVALVVQAAAFLLTIVILTQLHPVFIPAAASVTEITPSPKIQDEILAVPPKRLEPVSTLQAATSWIAFLYLVGVAFVSLRNVGAWMAVQRLRSLGTRNVTAGLAVLVTQLQQRLGIDRPVRLLQSTWVHAPLAFGVIKPLILMPASLMTCLSPQEIEAILLHELAHIRRHDYLMNLLQTIFDTAFFFHPAAWWISARIREERENCCDDMVLAVTEDRETYAQALAAVGGHATTLALAASGGSLLDRIQRILGIDLMPSRRALSGTSMVMGVLVFTICLYGSVHAAHAAGRANSANFAAEVEAAWRVPGKDARAEAMYLAIGDWLKENPTEVTKWVGQLPKGEMRELLKGHLAACQMETANPAKMTKWLSQLPEDHESRWIILKALLAWAQMDPATAVQWATQQKGARQLYATLGAAGGWAYRDAAAAAKWATQLREGRLRQFAISGVADAWTHLDPRAAATWVSQLSRSESQQWGAIDTVGAVWGRKDLKAAMKWASQLPKGVRNGAIQAIAKSRAGEDLAATTRWAQQLPEAEERQWAIFGVAVAWAQDDSKAAAEWASRLPTGEDRSHAFWGVAQGWTDVDPKAASDWAMQLPQGRDRDFALTGVAWWWAYNDRESAKKWASQLPDEERKSAEQQIANQQL